MKTISIELSEASIQRAIAEIEEYKNSINHKLDLFMDRMAQIGIDVVRTTMESVPDEDRGSYYVEDIREPRGFAIRLTGDKILFVEFGAGVIHSNPQNPKAAEMGFGVGTYNPKSGNAWNLVKWGGGWWYSDNGRSVHSYGNPAYMPMYKADVEIMEKARSVAKEVFGSS